MKKMIIDRLLLSLGSKWIELRRQRVMMQYKKSYPTENYCNTQYVLNWKLQAKISSASIIRRCEWIG